MKSATSKIQTQLAALLLGVAMLPAYAAGDRTAMSFKDFDTNRDGHLSLDEFKAQGKDDLAFKAADINGDEQLDLDEFDIYRAKKASDQPKAEPGAAMQPKPAKPSPGY